MTVAEMLRAAGAWLDLAANELDKGNADKARNFARMGQLGVESQLLATWLAEGKEVK